MEAEQSSYYREYPVDFGQKREIVGIGQSDTANKTLCRYCFQVHSFLAKKAPGTPVFGHCPYYYLVNYVLQYNLLLMVFCSSHIYWHTIIFPGGYVPNFFSDLDEILNKYLETIQYTL